MNKVQSKRLLNVARALREAYAARKKFNMDKFVFGQASAIDDGEYDFDSNSYCGSVNNEAEFCGTPACALGHYGARTDLQRVLKVAYLKSDDGVKYAKLQFFGTNEDVDFSSHRLQDHFGLDVNELHELFDYDGCGGAKTALQAAKYIERLVAKKMYPGRNTR